MSTTIIEIRRLTVGDVGAASVFLDGTLVGREQIRLGEVVDVLRYPGFGAWAGDRLVGLATWSSERPRAELATLAVAEDTRGANIGAALLEWIAAAARKFGTRTLWAITTNDNLDALRLYQRHAFRLVELRAGGVEAARVLKPRIPRVGAYDIPIRDELILERRL